MASPSRARGIADIRLRLQAFNCDGRYGAALLAVCAVLLASLPFGNIATHLLRYDRAAIAAGEWWRLLTAHFVHLGLRHAALDMAGLVLLWALFARDLRPWRWAIVLSSAAAAVDCGLWFRDPGIDWYLGASGVLHGAAAAAAFVRCRRGDVEGWALAALLIAKLAYEQIHGSMPFDGGMPVVVDAHLYAALGGFAAAILLDLYGSAAKAGARAVDRVRAGYRRALRARASALANPAASQQIDQADQEDGAQK